MSFYSIVDEIKIVLFSANLDEDAISNGIKNCNKVLRIMNAKLKTTKPLGEKQHLMTSIGQVKSFRQMYKALQVVGEGYTPANPNRANYTSNRVRWEDLKSAFNKRIRTGVITNLSHKEVKPFLEDCGLLFRRRLNNKLKLWEAVKVNSVFCGEFIRKMGDEEIFELKYLTTKNSTIYRNSNINEWFDLNISQSLLIQLEEFQERDSGWALSAIINLTININKYTPQLGSSYIELPAQIKRKKACVNIQNSDQACFAWSVVAELHPVDHRNHPGRTSSYPHYSDVLNLTGIQFPMTLKQIPRFEKQNDISINLYVLNKNKKNFTAAPTYLTKDKKEQHVNLLLIQNEYADDESDDEEPITYHYVWIKNLSRLVSSQLSIHHSKKYFCERCLHYFYSDEKLSEHSDICKDVNNYRVKFMNESDKIKFKNFMNRERASFVIYSDVETLLKPIQDDPTKNTMKFQHHEAHSVGYYFKYSYDDSLSFYRSYRGPNCAQWFADELEKIAEDVEPVFWAPVPMDKLTSEQYLEFRTTDKCHMCSLPLKGKRVRDHCHLTGKYRGAAHPDCNLNYQDDRKIPVVFHNFSGYDAHFLIKEVTTRMPGDTKIIPNNTEKYISVMKYVKDSDIQFRFFDSFRFMASSLDKLASYLPEKKIVRSQFPHLDEDQFKLLTRKGVFPYEHLKSWQSLDEMCLPTREQFYSSLSDSGVSEEDYAHAQKVWCDFQIQTLGEYSDLYLKTDVLLLADIFENFRDSCLQNYELDPAHYFTAPGLSWDAMLKTSGVELDYIHDVDILLFLERGIRGGLTQCSKRHSKANNKYMPDYDPTQPAKFLMYYDINAMYSWAMSQYLPVGDLEWVDDVEHTNFNVPDDSPIGYILEVDLEYPHNIHDRQKDLPMAPESSKPPGSKQKKLMATLFSKEKYVVHYRNMNQYIDEGLVVTKIHRALKFRQSDWLKRYIDLNTRLRTAAKNEFEKNLFKLMCNSVFGKMMENVRNYRTVKLVTKWDGRYGAEAYISKPNFHSCKIFEEDFVAIELSRTEVLFNKPIYVGMCILDISKTALYEFHYKYMMEKYDSNCTLCYTDTDSLIYDIRTDDVYRDMQLNIGRFDTSDYNINNPYGMPRANKKIPGLMKDENSGCIMTEFVGLRAKMYASRSMGKEPIKKAKGVKNYVVKTQINFEDYLKCLFANRQTAHIQNTIRSHLHQVYTMRQHKTTLSPHDDKRYLIKNSVETYPWGHRLILDVD